MFLFLNIGIVFVFIFLWTLKIFYLGHVKNLYTVQYKIQYNVCS